MKATQLVVEVEDVNRLTGWRFIKGFDSLKAANRKFDEFSFLHVRIRCLDKVLRDSNEERAP